jgi:hypothetical protein
MTLIELLRWIVETWPEVDAAEWQAMVLRAARRGIIVERWPGVAGAAEWQAMILRAARFGIAAGRERAPYDYEPEMMLAWWLTLLATDPSEYNARWHRARHPDPADIAFELDGPAGWGIGRWDGKPEPQYAAELVELDRQCHRCLDLLADFGAAGVFEIDGLIGLEPVHLGREIWRVARPDFIRNALVMPDCPTVFGARASLVPTQEVDPVVTVQSQAESQKTKDLLPASESMIDDAIKALYDQREKDGEPIPNIVQTGKLVRDTLKGQGRVASESAIQQIARRSRHAKRRQPVGRPKSSS